MADLDTRSKRASSARILCGWIQTPPAPDGTISQGDRQHIAWSYSGILAESSVPGQPITLRSQLLFGRSIVLPTIVRRTL